MQILGGLNYFNLVVSTQNVISFLVSINVLKRQNWCLATTLHIYVRVLCMSAQLTQSIFKYTTGYQFGQWSRLPVYLILLIVLMNLPTLPFSYMQLTGWCMLEFLSFWLLEYSTSCYLWGIEAQSRGNRIIETDQSLFNKI